MIQFKELGVRPLDQGYVGDKIKIDRILNREIIVYKYSIKDSKYKDKGNGKCLNLEIAIGETRHVVFTGSGVLMSTIQQIPKGSFPFSTKIVKENERYEFT